MTHSIKRILVLAVISLTTSIASIAIAQTAPNSDDDQTANSAAETVTFNFREAPWPGVLSWFAEKADLTLDLTDTPTGSFNYVSDREQTVVEALDVLNGYLLPRGYVTLRRNEFLVVLKTDNPILPNLIPTVPASKLDDYGNNELVRIIVKLQGLTPSELVEQVQTVLGPHGKASALDASESLVIQGFGRSLREVVELLDNAIVPEADDELTFKAYPLKHISATDAERQIQNLFGLSGGNPYQASIARRNAYYASRSRGRDDDRDRPAQPTPLLQTMAMNMKVSALGQTNTLLVTATPAAVKLVENILESIDVPPPDGNPLALNDTTPVLRVYKVQDADEDDVAETVDAVMPGVVINEDGRHDSIHVLATPREHAEVEKLIRIIDSDGFGGGVEVIRLTKTDPYQMSDLLTALFENEDRDDRPVIRPEPQSRSLVIRATGGQMSEIKQMLLAYGETGSATTPASTGSRFRKVSLTGSNGERIARAVEELLTEDRDFDNPIRVVVPSRSTRSTRRDDSDENGSRIRVDRDSKTSQNTVASDDRFLASASVEDSACGPNAYRSEAARTQAALQTTKNINLVKEESKKDAQSSRRQRVTIEVRDGELLMYSNDGKALDEVEDTVREFLRQLPPETDWTVFYLRAAAAEDVADQLAELLRGQTTTPLVGPTYGLETSYYDQPVMRIIPDTRTNALFISGTDQELDQAERFLEFLDTTELPESMRDRVPRAIPVKHADLNAVAEMIRELYKDFMVDPAAQMEMRRRDEDRRDDDERRVLVSQSSSSGQKGLRPPGIRLTLAVDTNTSELLVSCNEHLFEQIKEVVEARDAAAFESRPQMRIVELENIGAAEMGMALDELSPRISVSSTSAGTVSRSRTSSDSRSRDRRSNSSRRNRN